ncbi:hypothetical protein SteCoe_548 [Stentor coeruleus]|uniref:Nucleoplasmin-like domain-containing protein n=1 Tax=Stentor coeruleus TaxID=5963 RepID=A0A1R2D3Z3_9CILI|nr:hypothetical protein SteCoe_548 [Stentor coeruleus]
MIWGIKLSAGENYNLGSLKTLGEILKLSQLFLDLNSTDDDISVFASYEEEKVLLARLNTSRPCAGLDLFFTIRDKNKLYIVGRGSVNIIGYLEPVLKRKCLEKPKESSSDDTESLKNPSDSESEEIIIPPSKNKH